MLVASHVMFQLESERFAIPAVNVERALTAVEITPLPGAPAVVLGVVNLHGEVMPVLSARVRAGKSQPPVALHHKLLVLKAPRRCMMLVDSLAGVVAIEPGDIADAARMEAGDLRMSGVARLKDGLAVVFDVARFLSVDESMQLESAMTQL